MVVIPESTLFFPSKEDIAPVLVKPPKSIKVNCWETKENVLKIQNEVFNQTFGLIIIVR